MYTFQYAKQVQVYPLVIVGMIYGVEWHIKHIDNIYMTTWITAFIQQTV